MLAAELKALEQIALCPAEDPAATVAVVSATLSRASQTPDFPTRQLHQWLWIGSQYRQHAAAGGFVAAAAAAGLAFLDKRAGQSLTESDIQDLNWVLETTIKTVCDLLDRHVVGRHLSPGEIAEIEGRLAIYADASFDPADVRSRLVEPMAELVSFSTSPLLKNVIEKIEALFAAAGGDTFAGRTARSALLYFAEHQDAVSDSYGFLGLLDDVYVIDLAYAAVEQQTRCLPLLMGLLQGYPYVADLALTGTPPRPLDLYGQYVCCAALDALYEAVRPSMLVVREAGPFPLLAALFAAVEASRRQANLDRQRLTEWSVGQHIVVSDEVSAFKVVYLGETDVGAERRFRLGVDKSGSLTAPRSLAPYMAATPTPHKRLSGGRDFGDWLKSRHADPLLNLTGTTRTRAGDQECVLLLGPRSKLDRFAASIRPLGRDIGAAVGLRYIADDRQENIGATATDAPFIYACSDPDTAYDLIRNPPPQVRGWRVIVDGARQMRALHASLTSDGGDPPPHICVLVELFDREASAELLNRGFDVWYLEDLDVQPPPTGRPAEIDDAAERMLARQGTHWNTVHRVHAAPHEFLESVDAWMVRASETKGTDSSLQNLELLVSAFMRAALARPLASSDANKNLRGLVRTIAMQASSLRNFSTLAAELHEIFAPLARGEFPAFERRNALAAIADIAGGKATAVVCRSAAVAAACREDAESDPKLSGMIWTNLEGVRSGAPYDRVVVPGWLDRLSMRELAGGGYSERLDLLFYPFERRWFERTTAAGVKWERRIEVSTLRALSNLAGRLRATGRAPELWNDQTTRRLAPPRTPRNVDDDVIDESDAPEFEKLEARSVESVRRAVFQGREHQPTAKAQLVMFEHPGTYAFLPAGGKVIVLADPTGVTVDARSTGNAEKVLFRSVASLEPGCLLALPIGGDRDLIDVRADRFLETAADVRQTAGTWKRAFRRYMDRTGFDSSATARRLAQAGVKRHTATIRSWTSTTATIAPRGYREVLPVVAKLTGDTELLATLPKVLQAIDLIYRARAKAAESIVAELFAGDIDLEAAELKVEHGDSVLRYALHRVQSVGSICDVPHDVVGRLRTLASPHANGSPSADPIDGVGA
ncbi:DrmE family protein [Mesorhizobium sp. M0684]|uniref:DrmE family protein n=1 Tax=unclassified Mesorhizobium TaxID=325217 RepID=UPI00333AC34F